MLQRVTFKGFGSLFSKSVCVCVATHIVLHKILGNTNLEGMTLPPHPKIQLLALTQTTMEEGDYRSDHYA